MHLFQEESLTFMEHFHFTKSFFIVGKVSLYFKKKYSHKENNKIAEAATEKEV